MGMAFSMTPPWRVWPCGRTCFFAMFRPSTTTLLTCGNARETVPCLPLSLPVMIKTVSPFLIFILARWRGFFSFCFVAIFFLGFYTGDHMTGDHVAGGHKGPHSTSTPLPPLQYLEHLRRKRSYSQEVSIAQFTGYRAEDTCASRVVASGDEHCRVIVEANMRTVGSHILFCYTYYHRIHDLTFFHLSIRCSLLDRGFNNIPYLGITFGRTAHYADTHNFFCASVIGDFQTRLRLNHRDLSFTYSTVSPESSPAGVKSGSASASTSSTGTMPLLALTISTRRQRFVLLSGRHSSMRTKSPI